MRFLSYLGWVSGVVQTRDVGSWSLRVCVYLIVLGRGCVFRRGFLGSCRYRSAGHVGCAFGRLYGSCSCVLGVFDGVRDEGRPVGRFAEWGVTSGPGCCCVLDWPDPIGIILSLLNGVGISCADLIRRL